MKTLKKIQLLLMALIVAVGVSSCDEKKSKSRDDDKEETEETEKVKNEFNTGYDVLDEGLRRLNRVCLKGQKADSREELREITREFGKVFGTWERENIEILDSVYEIEDAFYKFDAEIEKMQNAFWEKRRSLIEKEERELEESREPIMAELPDVEEIEIEEVPLEEFVYEPDYLLYEYYKEYYYKRGEIVIDEDGDRHLERIYRRYITDDRLLEKKLEKIYSRRSEPDESKEIKDVSEVMESEAQFGNKDVEGTAYLNTIEVEDMVIVEEKPAEAPKVEQIFTVVEQPASYPGGETALMNWLANNIQYPSMAAEEGAQGRVVVQFVVEKDGRVGQVNVVRGRHPELDKEAVRVVKSIKTRFTPGKNNGQPVRQWFTLPINFKLPQ